jgi:DNA-binding MarR family transcriptional regulator
MLQNVSFCSIFSFFVDFPDAPSNIINHVNEFRPSSPRGTMTTPTQDTATQIFELGPRIARMIRQTMKEIQGANLTLPQYRILARVNAGMGKASVLCEIQGVSLPAMSRMVDTLVRKGLLLRTDNTEDRRQVVLKLSPAGRKAHDHLKTSVLDEVVQRLEQLNKNQQQELATSLRLIESIFP